MVAFEYAGDLWVVSRNGGQARRLTSTPTVETDPKFSPDGSKIAFTATVGGNTDVYVVPAAGGDPTRLTFHPGLDRHAAGAPTASASSSGRRAKPCRSGLPRFSSSGACRRLDGAVARARRLPMPRAFTGTYSPDGRRVAYEEFSTPFASDWYDISLWRHYRGGRTHPIRVINLADYSVEKLPWKNSNDSDPMWIGNTIYFLSDRNGTTNLFAYRPDTKR